MLKNEVQAIINNIHVLNHRNADFLPYTSSITLDEILFNVQYTSYQILSLKKAGRGAHPEITIRFDDCLIKADKKGFEPVTFDKELLKDVSFEIFYTKAQQFKALIKEYALENDRVSDSYHMANVWYTKMIQKSRNDKNYRYDFWIWLRGRTSTIALRTLVEKVGGDYWSNLKQANGIDYLDSVSCAKKIKE